MKKFFSVIPLQNKLFSYHYHPVDNHRLDLEGKISFPILAAVNGYAEPGEEIRMIALVTDQETAMRNREALSRDAQALCERKGILLPKGVEFVIAPDDERVLTQIETFQKLIDLVDEDDELFYCMTYGTKPQSNVLQMAVQYAYRIKKNTMISCVVYGKVNRPSGADQQNYAQIFDMTALVQLDELVRMLADRRVKNPENLLRQILSE